MTKLKIPQIFVKRSTRLGRKSTVVNPPPRPRPIEVLFDCEHDKRLLMANAYLLKNSHVFVKPKLKWSDRQKEKSLLKLRYDLIQSGFDRKFFRIRDLKLFYSGTEINDNEPFDSISGFLGTIDTNNDENKNWLELDTKCLLLNIQGLDTISKQCKLLDFVNVEKVDIIFSTETWFNENSSCSLFGTFKLLARNDRKKGPRGGVAILVRSTFLIHAEELCPDEFDSAVAVGLQLSGNSALLVILVYLPYPSPYEVSMNDLERFFDAAACSFRYKYPSNQYSHSLCVLGDFNLPSTGWKLMHSSSAENSSSSTYFLIMDYHPLF